MDDRTNLDLPLVDADVPPETSESDVSVQLRNLEAAFRERLEQRTSELGDGDSHVVRLRTNLELLEQRNHVLGSEMERLQERLRESERRAAASAREHATPGDADACASVFQPEDSLRRAQAAERALAAAHEEIEQLNHRICIIERLLPDVQPGQTSPDVFAQVRRPISDEMPNSTFSQREQKLVQREDQAQALRDALARRAEELADAHDQFARYEERIVELELKLHRSRETAAEIRELALASRVDSPTPVAEIPISEPHAPAHTSIEESAPLRAASVDLETPAPADDLPAEEDGNERRFPAGELPEIEGYHLERVCEVSPLGASYLARDEATRRPLIVQLLQARVCDKLEKNLDVLAETQHGNLFSVLKWGTCASGAYLVSERPAGERAQAWIDRIGSLPEQSAVAVSLQVARGLRQAAFRGVHHGDLGPDTIRIEATGRVRIENTGRLGLDPSRTPSALAPAFASPERLRGSPPPNAASDIYSLGALLFTLLTGQPPYEGDEQSIQRIQSNEPFPDVRGVRPEVSQETADLIRSMTHRDVDRRLSDWDRTLLELERRAGAGAAQHGTPIANALEWVREHPAALAALIAAPLAILALIAALLS